MDSEILEKLEYSILNDLGYIGCLEKKNGNKTNKAKDSLISKDSEAWKSRLGQKLVKNSKRIMLRIVLNGLEKSDSPGLCTGAISIFKY